MAESEQPPPSAPAPVRAGLALGLSALLGVAVILAVRGTRVEYGLLVHADAGRLARDAAGLLAGAVAVGLFAPLIAGHYISGLPLRAWCVALAGAAFMMTPAPEAETVLTESYWRALALAELLVLGGCTLATIATCWLVDTRITFPRLYPDPTDRPNPKHTTGRHVLTHLLPHAAGVAAGVGGVNVLLPRMEDAVLRALLLAVGAAVVTTVVQRLRPARGSMWAALGVLAGLAWSLLARAPAAEGMAPEAGATGPPLQAVTAAAAMYAAIVARGRPAA